MRYRKMCWHGVEWTTVALLLIGLGGAVSSFGQDCALLSGYTNFGQNNQFPNDMVVDGNYAYTADSFGFTIYEFGDPAHPSKVGELLLHEEGKFVAVSGTSAFVTGRGRGAWLQIIDISDPASPELLESFEMPANYPVGLAASGTKVYAAFYDTLLVFDVSNPASPRLLASYQTLLEISGAFTVSDAIAYVAGWYVDGAEEARYVLEIIDLSDPTSPTRLGTYMTPAWMWVSGIVVSDNIAYLANSESGLQIVDVSDPASPGLLASVGTGGSARCIAVSDGSAYVANTDGRLLIFDLSDPGSPVLLSSSLMSKYPNVLEVSRSTLCMSAGKSGLDFIDVSDPVSPRLLASVDVLGYAENIVVSDRVAYVADGGAGLQIIDLSNPIAPTVLGAVDTPGNAKHVVVSGNLACVLDSTPGFRVIDVSDPAAPVLLSSNDMMGESSRDLAVSGNIAYVVGDDLYFVDISDPETPVYLGLFHTQEPRGVAVAGSIAYVVNNDPGFQVIDVSSAAEPSLLASLEVPDSVDITVSGNMAYLREDEFLHIVDVSDPSAPALINSVDLEERWQVGGLTVSGGIAYVGLGEAGLQTIDVSDPTKPALKNRVLTRHPVKDLALDAVTGMPWLAEGALVEGLNPDCPTCDGLQVTSDPETILTGGRDSVLTVRVLDLLGRGKPGQTVTGSTDLGSLSAFIDNGDGSYNATLTSGEAAGSATIEVSVNGAVCSMTTQLLVVNPMPPTGSTWIPVAIHAPGAYGSSWRTTLDIVRTSRKKYVPMSVTLWFQGPSGTVVRSASLGNGQVQLLIPDVVDWLGAEGAGAVSVASDQPFELSSRTYTELDAGDGCFAGGTLGQFLASSDHSVVLGAGQSAWVPHLIETAAFRTNLAVTNTGSPPATVRVKLYRSDGTEVGSFQLDLDPGEWLQDNRPYADRFGVSDLEGGYAKIEVLSGSGIIGYASVVDNTTNDPTTIPLVPVGAGSATDNWIPVASHDTGSHNSLWRTDLGILNAEGDATEATIFAGDAEESIDVCAGCQVLIHDVLGGLGVLGSAALRITTGAPVIVTSRTFTVLPSEDPCRPAGTLGQYLPSSAQDTFLEYSKNYYLPQLAENTSFRTNIAFTNTGDTPTSVRICLYDSDDSMFGSMLGCYELDLGPGEWVQDNRPFAARFGRGDIEGGYAVARQTSYSGGGVVGYASLVDNITNDPTTIPLIPQHEDP